MNYGLKIKYGQTLLWLLMIAACVCQPSDCLAQKKKKAEKERKVSLQGRVLNSFTKAGVEAKVTLMTADSAFVDSTRCWYQGHDSQYWFEIPAKPAKYIIKAEHQEYYTTYLNYEVNYIARNTSFEAPQLLMKRKNPTKDLDQMLDQVEVVASKVKFLHKGDTLIFNADAFNIPDGSMLDDLIRQLPGVELKKGGEIYVNGRKVDELLLNGDRFINNDRQLMLDNLPYYVVKDIQVYDRLNDRDKWEGEQTEQKEYVMDVKMKKEFLGGYLGNVDVGAGTNDRWLGRLFAMRHSDHSQLAIFSNLNNVNVYSRPGESADWDPNEYTQNEMTMKNIGISWVAHDKDKTFDEELNANVQWRESDYQIRTASEQFTTAGNIYSRSMSSSVSDLFDLNFRNYLTSEAPFGNKNFFIRHNIDFHYTKGDSRSLSRNASLSKDPSKYNLEVPQMLDSIFSAMKGSELFGMTTNRAMSLSKNESSSFNLSSNVNFNAKMPWGDILSVNLNGSYDKQTVGKSFSRNKTKFLQDGSVDFRNEYQPSPSKNYNFDASVGYDITFQSGWRFRPELKFGQSYSDTANEYYRLDKLGKGWDADSDESILGQLPSTRDSMQVALDRQNSQWHDNMNRRYDAGLTVLKNAEGDSSYSNFHIQMNVTKFDEWMRYDNIDLSQTNLPSARLERRNTLPSGGAGYLYQWFKNQAGKGGYLNIDYHFNVSRPSFTQLYNITLTNNPLVTRYSNPDLKNSRRHSFGANFSNWGKRVNSSVYSNISLIQNNWGTRTLYNPEKGSYVYKPGNVNGNWNALINSNFHVRLDSADHWNMNVHTNLSYDHNVDFDIKTIDDPQLTNNSIDDFEAPLSKVNTVSLGSELGGEYTYDELRLGVSGRFNWRNSTSKKENFQTINAFEFNYGFSGQYTIKPWALNIATSITMYSKRGYQEEQMNTDDLIWNMGISKSFLKGKPLTLKLEGVDLLHQLSEKEMYVDAQGRTETWTNSIPNYIMLHAIYKFNINPKKK